MAFFHVLQVADKSQISQTGNTFSITFPLDRFLEHTAEDIKNYYYNTDENQLNFLLRYPAIITIENFDDEISLSKISKISKNDKLRSITAEYEILASIPSPQLPETITKGEHDIGSLLEKYKQDRNSIQNILNFSNLERTRFHWAIKNGNLFDKCENSFLSNFTPFRSNFSDLNDNIKTAILSFESTNSSLFSTNITLNTEPKSYNTAKFIEEIININKDIESKKDREVFFRGHSDSNYKLEPSLLRTINLSKPFEDNEHSLFWDLLTTEPRSFTEDASCFDILTRMQHYSLPTRLLDISSNPLTALYFACSGSEDKDGQVILFSIKKDHINYFDSDKASCLTNLAKLKKSQKLDLLNLIQKCEATTPPIETLTKKHIKNCTSYAQFIHFIKQEKPYFEPKVKIKDLKSIICVKGRLNQERITAQSGSFLIFGLNTQPLEYGNDIFNIHRVTIPKEMKKDILKELDLLKINSRTVYPSMENSSIYIKGKLLKDAK
ncbi:FRG domain-containing protein [Acinetobacter sp.]|uniref:FRG domain-containing protein n=1 Tax=Acinetobacter sp. TaxID=472 RepID=UPI0031CEADB0